MYWDATFTYPYVNVSALTTESPPWQEIWIVIRRADYVDRPTRAYFDSSLGRSNAHSLNTWRIHTIQMHVWFKLSRHMTQTHCLKASFKHTVKSSLSTARRRIVMCEWLSHFEDRLTSLANLNLPSLLSAYRGKRDRKNQTIDGDFRLEKWDSKCHEN